jgi:hypothetical protein
MHEHPTSQSVPDTQHFSTQINASEQMTAYQAGEVKATGGSRYTNRS